MSKYKRFLDKENVTDIWEPALLTYVLYLHDIFSFYCTV